MLRAMLPKLKRDFLSIDNNESHLRTI